MFDQTVGHILFMQRCLYSVIILPVFEGNFTEQKMTCGTMRPMTPVLNYGNGYSKMDIQQAQLGGTFEFTDASGLDFGVTLTEMKNRSAFSTVSLMCEASLNVGIMMSILGTLMTAAAPRP